MNVGMEPLSHLVAIDWQPVNHDRKLSAPERVKTCSKSNAPEYARICSIPFEGFGPERTSRTGEGRRALGGGPKFRNSRVVLMRHLERPSQTVVYFGDCQRGLRWFVPGRCHYSSPILLAVRHQCGKRRTDEQPTTGLVDCGGIAGGSRHHGVSARSIGRCTQRCPALPRVVRHVIGGDRVDTEAGDSAREQPRNQCESVCRRQPHRLEWRFSELDGHDAGSEALSRGEWSGLYRYRSARTTLPVHRPHERCSAAASGAGAVLLEGSVNSQRRRVQ